MKETFGFTTALSYLMQGKRVRRPGWRIAAYIEVSGGAIVDENNNDLFEVENSSVILENDWELVE